MTCEARQHLVDATGRLPNDHEEREDAVPRRESVWTGDALDDAGESGRDPDRTGPLIVTELVTEPDARWHGARAHR